jgi:hypothetical protein
MGWFPVSFQLDGREVLIRLSECHEASLASQACLECTKVCNQSVHQSSDALSILSSQPPRHTQDDLELQLHSSRMDRACCGWKHAEHLSCSLEGLAYLSS